MDCNYYWYIKEKPWTSKIWSLVLMECSSYFWAVGGRRLFPAPGWTKLRKFFISSCLRSLWSTAFLPPCGADSLKILAVMPWETQKPSHDLVWALNHLGTSRILMLPLFNKLLEVGLKKCGLRPLMTFRGLGGLQSEGTYDTQQRRQGRRHQALTRKLCWPIYSSKKLRSLTMTYCAANAPSVLWLEF